MVFIFRNKQIDYPSTLYLCTDKWQESQETYKKTEGYPCLLFTTSNVSTS